jgi:hypothetical protein
VTEFPVPVTSSSPFGNLFAITAEPRSGYLWFTEGAANKIGRLGEVLGCDWVKCQ